MANFAIAVDEERWLSFFQMPFDDYEPNEGMATSEVALYRGGHQIGEPVRFAGIADLVDILVALQNGDDRVFTHRYEVQLDLLEISNDNNEPKVNGV